MKPVSVLFLVCLAACTSNNGNKADLRSEQERNQALVNDNLMKLDSVTGAMQNPDSFTMESFTAAAKYRDSLRTLLDSLFTRQFVLDSSAGEKGKP